MERREPSSFRDPSGYLFYNSGILYRQINSCYSSDYQLLMQSGLYTKLVEEGLLVPHSEQGPGVIRPQKIDFISYPYEWSFSMLRDAALVTLKIQSIALDYGMILKDASAYNIQFIEERPILIDTLSFTRYIEGKPWVAYRQFCQHFLGPLLVMEYGPTGIHRLLQTYIDGLPLAMVSKMLPGRSWFRRGVITHIHLQSPVGTSIRLQPKLSKIGLLGIIRDLDHFIKSLKWEPYGGWTGYKSTTSYSSEDFQKKVNLVNVYLDRLSTQYVWDLGSNLGEFSKLAIQKGAKVVSIDSDPNCTEIDYRRKSGNLPIVADLVSPSPGVGWCNTERKSLLDRGPTDTVMALGLVHHLAIKNNLPLDFIIGLFSRLGRNLIVEFIPKTDQKVQKLLRYREDIFPEYTKEAFESKLIYCYKYVTSSTVSTSGREVYLCRNS